MRERGFSLLELILVLVVISVVAAVTYPAMSRGRTAFHLRAVSRDVISSLRYAREVAVTQQKVMIALIDGQSQRVTVSDEVGDGSRSFALPTDVAIQGMTGEGVEMLQGPLRIRFLPNGSADDAQIALKAENGASVRITMDPITGAARILTDQGEKAR